MALRLASGETTSCFQSRSEYSRANSARQRVEIAHALHRDQKSLVLVEARVAQGADLIAEVVLEFVDITA